MDLVKLAGDNIPRKTLNDTGIYFSVGKTSKGILNKSKLTLRLSERDNISFFPGYRIYGDKDKVENLIRSYGLIPGDSLNKENFYSEDVLEIYTPTVDEDGTITSSKGYRTGDKDSEGNYIWVKNPTADFIRKNESRTEISLNKYATGAGCIIVHYRGMGYAIEVFYDRFYKKRTDDEISEIILKMDKSLRPNTLGYNFYIKNLTDKEKEAVKYSRLIVKAMRVALKFPEEIKDVYFNTLWLLPTSNIGSIASLALDIVDEIAKEVEGGCKLAREKMTDIYMIRRMLDFLIKNGYASLPIWEANSKYSGKNSDEKNFGSIGELDAYVSLILKECEELSSWREAYPNRFEEDD